jgi:enoyl-CoA hydratase/carnithine racemase
VRQLRKPILTAINGIAYSGGCELAQSTDFIIASYNATFGQVRLRACSSVAIARSRRAWPSSVGELTYSARLRRS